MSFTYGTAIAITLVFSTSAVAQAPTPASAGAPSDQVLSAAALERPVLADVQKLQIQAFAQALEIAQLKAELAQRDYDQAKALLERLLQLLQKPGYTLNLKTLAYDVAPSGGPKD